MPGVPGGRKPGQYEWYEIQDTIAYHKEFKKPKIIYPNIFKRATFAFDDGGFYCNQKTFIIPTDNLALLTILNSNLIHFWCLYSLARLQHGYLEPSAIFFQNCPVASMDGKIKKELEKYADGLYSKVDGNIDIKQIEDSIDEVIYSLYKLSPDEVQTVIQINAQNR